MRTTGGFTLLEMLVALAVFAILGVMSAQLVTRMIDFHEATVTRGERFTAMQRALDIVQRDVMQLADRPVRDELGDELPALRVATDVPLELTRLGWRNPLELPRSETERVAYQVQDKSVVRYFWNVLDRAQDSQPVKQVLLEDVDRFEVVVLDASGNEHTFWPLVGDLVNDPAMRIAGIKLSIEMRPYGEIVRIWDVPQPFATAPAGSPPGGAT